MLSGMPRRLNGYDYLKVDVPNKRTATTIENVLCKDWLGLMPANIPEDALYRPK
jgi:hypothetical protein